VYTLGDLAGRRFSKVDDGEIFIGVPFERLYEFIKWYGEDCGEASLTPLAYSIMFGITA
jgi:hypothetical protein